MFALYNSDQILHDLAQGGAPGALREKLTAIAASVEEDAFVKPVAREIGSAKGPMDDIVIDPQYFDCTVPADKSFVYQTDSNYAAFIYVIDGVGETVLKRSKMENW